MVVFGEGLLVMLTIYNDNKIINIYLLNNTNKISQLDNNNNDNNNTSYSNSCR